VNPYFLALIVSFVLVVAIIIFPPPHPPAAAIKTQAQEEVIKMPNISPTVLSTNAATFVSNST
jgi:hypothetical protein